MELCLHHSRRVTSRVTRSASIRKWLAKQLSDIELVLQRKEYKRERPMSK